MDRATSTEGSIAPLVRTDSQCVAQRRRFICGARNAGARTGASRVRECPLSSVDASPPSPSVPSPTAASGAGFERSLPEISAGLSGTTVIASASAGRESATEERSTATSGSPAGPPSSSPAHPAAIVRTTAYAAVRRPFGRCVIGSLSKQIAILCSVSRTHVVAARRTSYLSRSGVKNTWLLICSSPCCLRSPLLTMTREVIRVEGPCGT